MEDVDAIVVGAGVVGLAVARALAEAGRSPMILEAEDAFGTVTSSRNSEVIHAGLYYPPGSEKARLCVRGRDLMYEYAQARSVPHRRCGKLLVAADQAEMIRLDAIAANAAASGVHDLVRMNDADIQAIEPEVVAAGGYLSPSTGIIDSHAFMLSLLGDVENAGGMIVFHTPVAEWSLQDGAPVLTTGGDEPMTLRARLIVNAAGHGAPRLLQKLAGYPVERQPAQHFAKGSYYALQARPPFTHLIYPAPGAAHLGVHATLDMAGRVKFGPDIEWVDHELDLEVNPAGSERFYEAIRRFWPGLPDGSLVPDYAGVRPKIHGPNEPMPDFRIEGPADHGMKGIVNLIGIESPGLTASLAIAERVTQLIY